MPPKIAPTVHAPQRFAGNGSVALQPKTQLPRILRMRDLVLLIIGTVIGSGIFLVPGSVLRPVGNSVGVAMMVWLTGGVLSLLGALTYGELTALRPEAGGLYVFIRDTFGPLLAFLYGWTLFFVISSGSVATLAVAFSNYLSEFISLSPWIAKAVSVLMIVAIAVVNVRGTRQSADLQNITTAVKVAAIVAMSAILLWFGKNPVLSRRLAGSTSHTGSLLAGFGLAMISVLWAYEGWQYATFSAGRERQSAARFSPFFPDRFGRFNRNLSIRQSGLSCRHRPRRGGKLEPGGYHLSCRGHGTETGETRRIDDSHLYFQCGEFNYPHGAEGLLRDGKGRRVLQTASRSTSSIRNAGLRCDQCGNMVCGVGVKRDVRTTVDVRGFYRLDFLRDRGSEYFCLS